MKAAEIMTPDPVAVAPDASLDDAMRLMDEREIRHLPVVGRGGELVGVLGDRDLLAATGWLPERVRSAFPEPTRETRRVRDLMQEPVLATPDDELGSPLVERVLVGSGCLIVVDGGVPVGIVTDVDLLAAFCERCRGPSFARAVDPLVSERMSPGTVGVDSGATLEDAARLCVEHRVRHLPVLQGELLVGMVSDRDLRRAHGCRRPGDLPVSAVMTTTVRTVEPEAPLSEAAREMVRQRIGALPVLADGLLVGVLSSADVVRHCVRILEGAADG